MRTTRGVKLTLFATVLAVLAACAPTTLPGADDETVNELQRTAE